MKKNGQIQSQVFIYILSIIIISMVFLFGYRSIRYITQRAEQVELAELKLDLEEAIDRLGYDSSTNKDLILPGRYTKICFADLSAVYGGCDNRSDKPNFVDYIIQDAVADKTANVFLISNDLTEEKFLLEKITLGGQGCICSPTRGGRVKINLIGKGNTVELKFV